MMLAEQQPPPPIIGPGGPPQRFAEGAQPNLPDDWNGDTGCVYARLHARGIAFTPAAGFPCICHAHTTT